MRTGKGRRFVRLALAALVAAWSLAARAQTPRALSLYPLAGIESTSREKVAEAQSLLESAAAGLARRGQNVYPATPLLMRPSCGQRAPEVACLARLAKDGVIVFGAAHLGDGILAVTLRAVDARGKVYGPVRAGVDSYIQSSEPYLLALLALDARMGVAPEKPLAAAPRLRQGEDPRKSHRLNLPALNPPVRGPPIIVRRRSDREEGSRGAPSGWRTAGKVLVGSGLALAAAGAGVAWLDRRLSDSLDQKFQDGTLTAADAGSYRRVDRYNTAATALLVAGAAVATTGVTFWILAPDGSPGSGPRVGVSGRF